SRTPRVRSSPSESPLVGEVTAVPSRRAWAVRCRAGTLVFFCSQGVGQLAAALDPELGVRAGQVTLDGLEGDVELTGDLAVGPAFGGKPGDPQLAGGQGLDAGAPGAPRAGARRLQLVAGPGGQRPGAAARGQIQRPGERITGRGAFAGPAQGRPQPRPRRGRA